jgi:cadmium resistance protein CadD (predicted permease)
MIGAPVRRYTRLLMPFVFVTLGVLILYQAGTLKLLKGFMF